ncbi:ATP-dependent DNA helicase [Candidatus Omnitrophota bacterium]
MPNYEVRNEQIEMAEAVNSAIYNQETLVVEAGTGVGKSFSYLIPIAEFTHKNSSRVMISTNTISLQEQIVHKDIPFLEKALGRDFKAVLVKGRRNYLCLRRLHRSNFKQRDLFADEYEMRHFAKIVAWSYRTEDGSLYDLDEEPDPKVWDMVSANREMCLGKKCSYFKQCFFQRAREKIHDAHILVINHHLFFSNLALQEEQKSMFPEYDVLVFDEAHTIESVATEHLGASVSNSGVRYLMELLFNPKKQKGFLLTIEDKESIELVELIRHRSESFFKEVRKYFEERRTHGGSDSLRIRKPDFIANDLSMPLSELAHSLTKAKNYAKTKEDELEISSFVKRVNALNNSLNIILGHTLENYVYWIECSKNKKVNKVSMNTAPINTGEILKESLFSTHKTIVFTSATLSTDNDSFRYFKERSGITHSKELKLGSSFDYENQVRMYIAKNMPSPDRITEYAEALTERIKKYIELTNGSAFVLFTSYSLMNIVHEELGSYLEKKGFSVLKQGAGLGRSKMLSRFRKERGSILFGVDSFWQGVDVQGSALSNVIITKLPFAVPDHPIIEARIEDIQKRGGDAFLEYNLPEAVLRFKQGFGRLIRSKNDTGIIVILDSRIINKAYGRQFLNSIPRCELIIER